MGSTLKPAATAALTTRSPGSLMPGVPASVTSATFSPRPRRCENFFAALGFVELEVAQERFGNFEMPEQLPGVTRVFGRDDVALLQHAQCAQRDVFQIADRRRDQIKHAHN